MINYSIDYSEVIGIGVISNRKYYYSGGNAKGVAQLSFENQHLVSRFHNNVTYKSDDGHEISLQENIKVVRNPQGVIKMEIYDYSTECK